METTEERILRKYGYDPTKFTIADDHKTIVAREPLDQTTAAVSEQVDGGPSALGVFARSAAREAIPALSGVVGGGLGALGGTAVGGPVGGFIGGVGAGLAAAEGARELQEKYLPEGIKSWMAEGQAEHPTAALLGNVAPALTTMNPAASLRNIGALARATPTLTRYTPAQIAALRNMAVNVGLGAGIPAVRDVSKGEVTADTAKQMLLGGGLGLLGTEPSRLGTRLSFGAFQPSRLDTDAWAGAPRAAQEAMATPPAAEEPGGALVATPSWRFGGPGRAEHTGLADFQEALRRRGLAETLRLGAGRQPAGLLPAPVEVMPPEVPEAYRTERVGRYEPDFTIGGRRLLAAPPETRPPEVPEAYRTERVAPYEPDFTMGRRKLLGAGEAPEAPVTSDEAAQMVAFRRKHYGEAFDDLVEEGAKTSQLSKLAAKMKKLGVVTDAEHATIEAELQKEAPSIDRIENVLFGERAQPASQLGRTTPEWDELIKSVAQRHYGQKVEAGKESVMSGGQEVAGKITLPKGVEQGLVELSKRAGIDTGPHELLHGLLDDILKRGTPGEQRFAQRVINAAGGEEAFVQAGGQEFTKRLIDEAGGKDPSLLKDLASFIKLRFLGRGTQKDLERLAANTLRRGAGSKQYRAEGEQSLKKDLANRAEAPVPERPDALNKQLELTLDKKSSKAVTLFPHGSPDVEIPKGLEVVEVPQGKAAYNPTKVSEADVIEAGKTRQFDATLLGMSKPTKPAIGENVVTTSKDGVKDVLTEVVAPGAEAEAAAAHAKAVPGGVSEVRPASEVAGERTQPLGPTEVYGSEKRKRNFDIFKSPIRRLETSGDVRKAEAADALKRAFSLKDRFVGKYSEPLRAMEGQSEKDIREAYDAMIMRDKNNAAPGPLSTPEAQKIYNQMSDTYRDMRLDQIAAGHMRPGGARPRVDPTGMFNVPARETMETLLTQQGTPRWNQLRSDFIQENIGRGYSQQEAEGMFRRYIDGVAKDQSAAQAVDFGAVSLPEGSKLPTSWLDPDPVRAWTNYVERFARARAWHDIVEKNARTANLFRGDTSLVKNPDVVEAFNSYRGAMQTPNVISKITQPAGRLVASSILGTVSRAADVATTPFKAMAYADVLDIPGMLGELGNIRKHYNDAMQTGFIRPGGNTVTRELLGAQEGITSATDRVARFLSKYQGSEALEKGARGMAQAFGSYIGKQMRTRALSGDRAATEFLNKMGSDWQTVSADELGTRVGRLFQGHYDARNLPSWVYDSPVAPFMTLSKWGVEQYNNFRQFALEPAVRGDVAPLLKFIAAHLVGGLAIGELKQLMTGKKPYIAEIEEIKKAKDPQRATEEAALKLGTALQITGMAGFPGDLVMDQLRGFTGKMTNKLGMPAMEVAYDAANRGMKALSAIIQGVPIEKVVPQVLKDIAKRDAQATQILMRGSRERALANMTRDYREYNRLRGKNEPIPAENIDYTRVAEREFDREQDPKKARELGRQLYKDAREKFAGNPLGFRQEIQKLRNARITWFPANPIEQRRYLQYITETQGQEKARTLLSEYRREHALQIRKRGMIAP